MSLVSTLLVALHPLCCCCVVVYCCKVNKIKYCKWHNSFISAPTNSEISSSHVVVTAVASSMLSHTNTHTHAFPQLLLVCLLLLCSVQSAAANNRCFVSLYLWFFVYTVIIPRCCYFSSTLSYLVWLTENCRLEIYSQ